MKKYVSTPVRKLDAMSLVTGKPVYTDDLAPKDCLIVKLLRSPHAHALIIDINTAPAMKTPGIVAVYTYKDVPQTRYTTAGQTYAEMSPYDRLILDQRVRFIGDAVAIVAGETEAAVDTALKKIKVKYQVLEAVIDPHEALKAEILVHPEDNWVANVPVGGDNKKNLCASQREHLGDVDKVLESCAYVVEQTYETKANQQAMMEPFTTWCKLDYFGRLNITSSTQIPFHVRRIVGHALEIPSSKVRVIKPRIGGGFGAKQTSISEVYPAFVTWKTGRPSKIIYSRYECQICSTPRHAMEIKIRIGADENGIIKAIDMYELSNTGAYGDHGPTTAALTGHKAIALYRHLDAYRFDYDVVYTNRMASGAYRGYGATQGLFAVETAVNELAAKMEMDPVKIREMNLVQEGDPMLAFHDVKELWSCTLGDCLQRAKEMINWDEKYPSRDMGNGKVRSVGVAMAMQGSAIAGVDVGGATLKLNEEGSYTLLLGCADMGTGCDTILAQIAADCLSTPIENISVFGVDTDSSPYDSGSYASSTTYATGNAVCLACEDLMKKIQKLGAEMLQVPVEDTDFDGDKVSAGEKSVSLHDIAVQSCIGSSQELSTTRSFGSKYSPPPFMVGMAEIELDKETGSIDILDYVGVIDCGTIINPNLARVQAEGGIGQGIGMALYEEVTYSEKGQVLENSFMQYKIPSRMDYGKVRIDFVPSYEPHGPFGAKSIGELVINTPAPALVNAIYNATGIWIRQLPATPEKIAMAILEQEEKE